MELIKNEETTKKTTKKKGATFPAPYSVMGGMDAEVEPVLGSSSPCRTHLFDSVMGGMDAEVEPVLEAVVLEGLTCLIL